MELSNKAMGPFCTKKTKQQVVTKWMMVFFLPLFVLLSYTGLVRADDLMAAGQETVTGTFGAGSSIAKWIILAEVIVGIITYIKTKNMFMLFGIAVVIVFTTIGFGLVA
ncbi:type IV conjugative transfer system pilin TraA [Yersinia ruckeri]|uniref:type IV conjugative transfer system pilin TraA n=1 Tax=Yersinia ruckeri TaxID=29486 RepID=UPI000691A6E7|nr:type IV conjugative transfer system pilin TraA [Yersinia ruckeri]AUQ43894.1 type IV conjugative transfer system pilin TraA [Yersinia ruckeri]WMS07315.1 type IV conjugative transfer system pilin TraA [Yersinia ruckeri]